MLYKIIIKKQRGKKCNPTIIHGRPIRCLNIIKIRVIKKILLKIVV